MFGCISNANSSDKLKRPEEISFQLPDSLFAFHDIKNSLFVNDFWYDRQNGFEFFSDSIRKIRFVKLDTVQQRKLVAPVITSEMDIDVNYVTQWMEGRFVSKQKNIGNLTPIIVWVNGEDYEGLFYILLDKDFNPVSHFRLNGGFNGGPNYIGDSLVELSPIRHSIIIGNKIKTYSITETIKTESGQHPSMFDSINFISDILPTGKIVTKEVDRTRYERTSESSNIFKKDNE